MVYVVQKNTWRAFFLNTQNTYQHFNKSTCAAQFSVVESFTLYMHLHGTVAFSGLSPVPSEDSRFPAKVSPPQRRMNHITN